MNIVKSLQWRYATKKFDNQKIVSSDKIALLKEAFNLTATSYGLQPLKLVVLQNKELQKELVQYSFNQEQVVDASHIFIICIENVIDKQFINEYFERVKKQRGTSDELLSGFRSFLVNDFSNKTEEDINLASTKQAYLALGNLLAVCASEQIDSCPMEGFEPENYSKVLKLNDYGISPVLILPVGYRSEEDIFAKMNKVRRDINEIVIDL